MDEPLRKGGSDSARRSRLQGRATRALIAGYIHELSERHGGGTPHDEPSTDERAEPAQGD